jgi:hypothetical protein
VIGDLRSADEVRSIADQVNAIGRMDAIIHNAGVYTERSRGSTLEGHAGTLAVNTLAPYMLTALIARPDRLVYLSSGLHCGGEGSLGDLDWTIRNHPHPAELYPCCQRIWQHSAANLALAPPRAGAFFAPSFPEPNRHSCVRRLGRPPSQRR